LFLLKGYKLSKLRRGT